MPETVVNHSELLRRYQPHLRYDALEPYFADAADEIVLIEGQRLKRHNGDDVAGAELTLEFLGKIYPDGELATPTDHVEAADKDYARRYRDLRRARPDVRNVIYGRAVEQGADVWLQYWFYFYLNDYRLAWGAGLHEGDWEMVQFRIPEGADEPTQAAYAQHNFCEVRAWSGVQKEDGHPLVFVGRGSHASFFETGFHSTDFYDVTDGSRWAKGGTRLVDVTDPPAWLEWPGRWGGTRAGGNGPHAPCRQRQWAEPSAMLKSARERSVERPPGQPELKLWRRKGLLVIDVDSRELPTVPSLLIVTVNSADEPGVSPRHSRFELGAERKQKLTSPIALDALKHYDVGLGTVDDVGRPGPAQIFLFGPAPATEKKLVRKLGAFAGRLVHRIRSILGIERGRRVPSDDI